MTGSSQNSPGDGAPGEKSPDSRPDSTTQERSVESDPEIDHPTHRLAGIAAADPGELENPESVDLDDPALYLNRELSELAFQRRVLNEALDDRNPLLERVKFLAIFTRNLDEFYMKRVGGLKQQMAGDVTELTPDGRTPEEQWELIFQEARQMFAAQTECYQGEIQPALADAGIYIRKHSQLDQAVQEDLRSYFKKSVLPTLTPLTFDPAHPFPFISNLSLSMAVLTKSDDESEPKFSRIKIPENRPRFVRVDDVSDKLESDCPTYVPIEEVIAANLDLLFPSVEVLHHSMFRVTRNAEVRRNEEIAEDLIEMIEGVLRERRFATVVRLEVSANMPDRVRSLLMEQLDLEPVEVIERDGMLDYDDLMTIVDLDRPDLKREPWTPQPHPRFASADDETIDVFEEIQREDLLVHHPYHSFEDTVQRFLTAAARDDDVLAIKAAIYRTAQDSKVIESLIEAAQNGKQVAVMVELKARFDEENNLRWVERLEEEGIHVAYGTLGLKTHTKTALVVREENDGVHQYAHVGTGNYHSETAKTYVDLGLLTADEDIGHDLVRLFNFFTGHSLHEEYRELLIAPENMRERFVELIRREARHAEKTDGEAGRIVTVVNRLEDPKITRELYKASMAGVDIDLVVRDICRLRPGIEGISDNVSVRSIVGRFLEHSRIFYFGNDGTPAYFIGSADWMTRNLNRRVEAITPIENPTLQAKLRTILSVMLSDNRLAWEMNPDGTYEQCTPGPDEPIINAQDILAKQARQAAKQASGSEGATVFDLEDPTTRAELDVDPNDLT